MNVLDIAIILLIAYGAYNGWKYGCFSSILSLLGSLFIFVLAFYIKNPLSVLFYENLPFQSFTGMFKGISSMNILVYELVSYLICLIILATVFGIILKATGIVDKLIKLYNSIKGDKDYDILVKVIKDVVKEVVHRGKLIGFSNQEIGTLEEIDTEINR